MLSRLLSLDEPVVIAHRGGSKLRPENTMIAFEHAVSLGVDALECDVHLSRDDEPVVIHDDTLDRTTDRTGPVSALTAAELARVDAAARFGEAGGAPFRGRGNGVPRLVDVLTAFQNLPVVVELKGERPAVAERALAVIRAAGAERRVIIGGFSDVVLRYVRQQAPEIVTSASRVEVQSALRRSWMLLRPRRTGFGLFQVPLRLRGQQILRRPFVIAARRGRVPVQAWIVDERADIQMVLDWGVTGIISDRPDVALAEIQVRRGR